MNLYQMALQVQPQQIQRGSCKMIWSHNTGLPFAFLREQDDKISLHISGIEQRLVLYERKDTNQNWTLVVTEALYHQWKTQIENTRSKQ